MFEGSKNTESPLNNAEIPELSPEIIEEILEKLADINAPGTGFTVLNAMPNRTLRGVKGNLAEENPEHLHQLEKDDEEAFVFVLRDGLLSKALKKGEAEIATRSGRSSVRRMNFDPGAYSRFFVWLTILNAQKITDEDIRKDDFLRKRLEMFKEGKIGENPIEEYEHPTLLKDPYWEASPTPPIGILVDAKPFKYSDPKHGRARKKSGGTTDEIISNTPAYSPGYYQVPITHRVSPRHFRGIVLGRGSFSDEELAARISRLTNTMRVTEINTPERLMPVYDEHGNLLWPKQMKYEEILKIVRPSST